MYRSFRVILRKNFLSNSSFQFENQSCYHNQLLRPSLTLQSSLLNQQCALIIRNLSSSPALRQLSASQNSATNVSETVTPPAQLPPDVSVQTATTESAVAAGATAFEPVPSEILQETIKAVATDPSLSELGLGGMSPAGWAQLALEWIHTTSGLPWWVCILTCTCVIRTLMFPLYVKTQKNTAEMVKYMPLTQELHSDLSEARRRGDHMEVARISSELAVHMKEHGLNPLKSMILPMAQAPVFVSFFVGLRGMANTPVPSMREGGWLWFIDLTVPDQYYLLPFLTSATLFLTLELGADFGKLQQGMGPWVKYLFRALPVIVFPFTLHFPSAILVYWTTTNTVSLVQALAFKIPGLKKRLGIPDVEEQKKEINKSGKGFVQEVKSTWSNVKVMQELGERERIDQIQFNRAGREAPVKTYKYDPTKVKNLVRAKPKS